MGKKTTGAKPKRPAAQKQKQTRTVNILLHLLHMHVYVPQLASQLGCLIHHHLVARVGRRGEPLLAVHVPFLFQLDDTRGPMRGSRSSEPTRKRRISVVAPWRTDRGPGLRSTEDRTSTPKANTDFSGKAATGFQRTPSWTRRHRPPMPLRSSKGERFPDS